ncbi:MAG: hypothetical protein Q4A29_07350 [Eubacteriales bacterium]|nr:hypothetical protein [Eubacteriales bacterium]
MIDVKAILFQICEDDAVYQKDIDLMESGLLDSFALLELFSELEDRGIFLQPTQIDRNLLRTVQGIERLVEQARAGRAESQD